MMPIVENVSRETCHLVEKWFTVHVEKLEAYAERLWWWNNKVNLISRGLPKEDLFLHIKHSLMPGILLKDSAVSTWVDAGTGGGLPGVPLAILFPSLDVVLNDISPKKGIVLRDLCHHLDLKNVRVAVGDISTLNLNHPFGVLSKHAFKVGPLLSYLDAKPWEEILLLKGEDYIDELSSEFERPLEITAYHLCGCEPTTFYAGKYLLRICRKV